MTTSHILYKNEGEFYDTAGFTFVEDDQLCERQFDWTDEDDAMLISAAKAADKLWTVVDTDEEPAMLSGYHHVNRLYYVISNEAIPEDKEFTVELD